MFQPAEYSGRVVHNAVRDVVMTNYFVFCLLICILLANDQWWSSLIQPAIWLVWPGRRISVNVVSSTYLWVEHDNSRLSIKIINVSGPSHEPWGMPPFKRSHAEKLLANFTLSLFVFVRKDANHLTTEPGMASSIRLLMTSWQLHDLHCWKPLRSQETRP